MTTRDLEARAEALLERLRRHNRGDDRLTAFEIRSVLKEIRAIGNLNRTGSLPDDVLARVNQIMRQAASEASKIAARLHLRKLH